MTGEGALALARAPEASGAEAFAAYLRQVGRGPTLSLPLDADQAAAAMGMILDGAALPEQVSALLLVLRFRGETIDELAGFVRATRARLAGFAALGVDLDWPSYADRHKQLPYFVLAARLLADEGVRVLMHGTRGAGPATTPAVLAALGIAPAATPDEAAKGLARDRLAYLAIEDAAPALAGLFALRPLLGVRSAANTFARALNPARAPAQVVGVFHPAYVDTHRAIARSLGQPRAAAWKGGGGEAQRNPEKPCRVGLLRDGEPAEEVWPALVPDLRHPWRDEPLDPERVLALWRGEISLPGPQAAVVGTVAIALSLLGRAETPEAALAHARELWRRRRR